MDSLSLFFIFMHTNETWNIFAYELCIYAKGLLLGLYGFVCDQAMEDSAAMLVVQTREANEECVVIGFQHGRHDFTCKSYQALLCIPKDSVRETNSGQRSLPIEG